MSKLSWSGSWLPVLHRLPPGDSPERREIALTFDDGPGTATPDLLHILARADAQATFFLTGQRIAERPDLVRAILSGGHAIYSHGFLHEHLERTDAAAVQQALSETEALLSKFRPTPEPYLIRLPYASGRRQAWMHRAIQAWSPTAQIAHWTYALNDHDIAPACRNEADVERLCWDATQTLATRPHLDGSILLMHDDPYDRNSPFLTAVATTLAEMVVRLLTSQRYRLVALRPLPAPSLVSRFMLES